MQLNDKKAFRLAMAVILLLCIADYTMLSEGMYARAMNDQYRKLGHIAVQLLITITGYAGLGKQNHKWLKNVWLVISIIPLLLLPFMAIICRMENADTPALMKQLGDIRLFFCSPVPFFIICRLPSFFPAPNSKEEHI